LGDEWLTLHLSLQNVSSDATELVHDEFHKPQQPGPTLEMPAERFRDIVRESDEEGVE
jgi:hypothetical protein